MRLRYLEACMSSRSGKLGWVRVTRAAFSGAALLLVAAVTASAAQAGQRYVYCRAMQTVMARSCCTDHADDRGPAPIVSAVAPECCQPHVMPSLGTWITAEREAQPAAPNVAAVLPISLFLAALGDGHEPTRLDPVMRTGPPASRARARLMVFQI